jgi:hypothetical protein
MAPAISTLQHQLAASQRAPVASPEDTRFRATFLPAAADALAAFTAPPARMFDAAAAAAGAAGGAGGGGGGAGGGGAEGGEGLAEAWAGFKALQERLARELRATRLDLSQARARA